MIKSERGRVEIKGSVTECLAEYAMLTKHFIISVPEEMRLHFLMNLTKIYKTAIMEATEKGGEEDEES